jgi:predicted 2-oxoglutarate/Fe(II)-dependent dioxygenase YbiX
MNKKLLDNNYIVIPNFISSYRANKLKDEFVEYSQKNNLEGDSQSPNSSVAYNYISFLELLCEKTPEISEILEETVLPTYTYGRVYKNGSILEKHKDRDACEISLTLHLGGDNHWPICIKTPEGENNCIVIAPGDAIMYRGTIAEHWRDAYEGEEYVQVFLHYVRSKGECSYTYFDKEQNKDLQITNLEESNVLDEICNDKLESDNNLDLSENSSIIKYPPFPIKATSKLEDFIRVYDNILSEEQCNTILKEYEKSDEWIDTVLGNGLIDKSIRNCSRIPISMENVIDKNFDSRKYIDNILFAAINDIVTKSKDIFSTCNMEIDTGYEILRYNPGEYYIQHTDSYSKEPRSLACSIQLNDNYDGGEFAFFDREIMIRSKLGSAIVFPSNFMFPHEIMPVIRGTRYSIITWLI